MTNATCTASFSGVAPQTVSEAFRTLVRLVAKEVLSWPMRALHTLALWQRRWESRHRLAHLEDRLHRDAGLTQAAILAETGKPFWTA